VRTELAPAGPAGPTGSAHPPGAPGAVGFEKRLGSGGLRELGEAIRDEPISKWGRGGGFAPRQRPELINNRQTPKQIYK
jgi:hypothetical protein